MNNRLEEEGHAYDEQVWNMGEVGKHVAGEIKDVRISGNTSSFMSSLLEPWE